MTGPALPVVLAVMAVGAVVSACSSDSDKSTEWVEPDSYAFTLSSWCGESTPMGMFGLRVDDGAVIGVIGHDESGLHWANELELDAFPTIGALLDEAADAEASGADVVDVVTLAPGGPPERIDIDYDTELTDAEACYEISNISVD